MERPLLRSRCMKGFLWVICGLAGCSYSSLDDEIFPQLLDATIAVDPALPAGAARIQVTLELQGGPSASSVAVLDRTTLEDANVTELAELALEFPTGFDAFIHADEVKVVDLENRGTTNADLATLCNAPTTLIIRIADTDEPDTYTLASQAVTVACN